MDPENPISVNAALRYWGCAIQAGAQVSGALGIVSPNSSVESTETVKKNFSPLPYCPIPPPLLGSRPDWNEIMLYKISEDARELLSVKRTNSNLIVPSVQFNVAKKTVNLFMPGFDKSEIKLYQVCSHHLLLCSQTDILLWFKSSDGGLKN